MDENYRIRRCGNDWRFCDGFCDNCVRGRQTASTSTEEVKMQYFRLDAEFDPLVVTDLDRMIMSEVRQDAVKLVEDFDGMIADGIIQELRKEGYTDLYVLDRRFVLEAISEKVARERR